MTWVWLSSPVLDFGGSHPGRDGDAQTVWLHADPLGALGLERGASPAEARRAYRQLARRHHPDVAPGNAEAPRRFRTLAAAARAVDRDGEVTVEPTAGRWWRFTGFVEPAPGAATRVAGLRFELHDLRHVPLAEAEETVRVGYGGESLELAVAYSDSRLAVPVWLGRIQHAAESAFLFLVCVLAIPVIALILALVAFLVWNWSVPAFWAFAAVILVAGYGAFGATLARGARRLPAARRAVLRTRAGFASLRSLALGRKP